MFKNKYINLITEIFTIIIFIYNLLKKLKKEAYLSIHFTLYSNLFIFLNFYYSKHLK